MKVIIDDEEFQIKVFEDNNESARLIPGVRKYNKFRNEFVSESESEIPSEELSGEDSFDGFEDLGKFSSEFSVGRDDEESNDIPVDDNIPVGDHESSHAASKIENMQKDAAGGENSNSMTNNTIGPMELINENNMDNAIGLETFGPLQGGSVGLEVDIESVNKDIEEVQDGFNLTEPIINENIQGGSVNLVSASTIKGDVQDEAKGNIGNYKKSKKRKNKKKGGIGIDLNKVAGSHFSHMIASSSSCSGSRRQNLNLDKNNLNSEVSFEVQETMEIGRLMGFDMNGKEEEVRKLIVESGVEGRI